MKKNYTYAFLTVFIWSTLATIAKILLSDIPNLETLTISSVFAFLFLLGINIKNGKIQELRKYSLKDYGIMAGLGFLGLFLYSALYYYGITMLSSQEACIINYLWPIMLVVFSCIILKEKFTFIKGIAMLVIWLIVAVCSAIVGPMIEVWKPIQGAQWLGMIWLGVVIDAVAYLLWALALNGVENSAKIANFAYLTPFLSLLVSAVVLKEKIQMRAVVALIFIVGGILLQSFYERFQKDKAA